MSGTPSIPVILKVLTHGEGLPLPSYQTAGAAGCDLHAAVSEALTLMPGARDKIPTGIALELPEGYEAQIRPRSGLAAKDGVTVLNAPGTIDSDYRGEILVLLVNHGDRPFEIIRGARIAQLVVAPVVRAAFVESAALNETARGEGGFGSTEPAQAEAAKLGGPL
ncbi:dUTP diphosphatase [Methyloferula stellata]|uniref:dUTP diphosphatase n=1 Tax=Methyloferula stellata TaxID=876270 RepID=UPI000377F3F6|nr:dUTP diphosphatase [Methyloferula stellata]